MSALEYWAGYQVAEFGPDITVEESDRMIGARERMYPNLEVLMPTYAPDAVILDYGCGPGHDTIQFVRNGAEFVYYADISPKALELTGWRLAAHGLQGRAAPVLVTSLDTITGLGRFAHHIHTAGVIHHVEQPVETLSALAGCLLPHGEIRMMVYSANSWFYREKCWNDPEAFRLSADPGSPITRAWTTGEVRKLATAAGLRATYVGSYRDPSERKGSGLMSCWSLRSRPGA